MRYILPLFIIVFITISQLPFIIKEQALHWLKSQGVNAPKLHAIDIDWLQGNVVIKGLEAKKDNTPPLSIQELTLDIDYNALLDKRILVNNIALSGFNSGLLQTKDHFYFGPIDINQFKSSDDAQQQDQQQESTSEWLFGLKEIALDNVSFSANMAPHVHNLHIEHASFNDLYQWRENGISTLEISGQINESPFAINTTANPLSLKNNAQLAFKLDNFVIESVSAPIIPELAGKLDVNAVVDVDYDQSTKQLTAALHDESSIRLSDLAFKDSKQSLNIGNLYWQGAAQTQLENNIISNATLTGKLATTDLSFTNKPTTTVPLIKFSELNWQGKITPTFSNGQLSHILINENIDLSEFNFSDKGTQLALNKLSLKEGSKPLTVTLEDNRLKNIKLASNLTTEKFALQLANQKVSVRTLRLNNSKGLTLLFNDNNPANLAATPELAISGLALNIPDIAVTSNNITLNGPLSVSKLTTSPSINFNSALNTNGLTINTPDFTINSAAIKAKAQSSALNLSSPVISNIQVSSSDFSLRNTKTAFNIASFNSLQLKNATFSPNNISLDALSIRKLLIASDSSKNHLTSLNQLDLNTLSFANNQLKINSIQLKDSTTSAQIDANGQLPLIDKLTAALQTSAKAPQNKAATNSKPLSYVINKVLVSGSNIVNIEDKSVEPWFNSQININSLALSPLSSATSSAVNYDLKGVINDRAKVSANGKITPFASNKNGTWNLVLSSLSMPVVSPYASKFSGYFLESGRLYIDSRGTIKNNTIKGNTKVNIQQLAVKSAGSKATTKTNSALSMPLDVAISVLENPDGEIKLSVPVTGSTDQPNFGYSSVVSIIAKKGLKQAAFGFLSKAIQPYGTLITIANTAIDARNSGSFINLAPVNFAPGEAIINSEMQSYLKKIADMMQERKKLKLKICAIGVTADLQTIRPILTEQNATLETPLEPDELEKLITNQVQVLASQRSELVQKTLEGLNIDKDRLFACFATTDLKNADAKPVVTLGL